MGNLTFLNEYGTAANGGKNGIARYLNGLYTLATKGTNPNGVVTKTLDSTDGTVKLNASTTAIDRVNNAAMMMFGIKGVISPCESLGAGPGGSIVIKPKTAPLDNTCLTYLWNNANSDRDRGDEDKTRSSLLPNTYETIADRWSGLRLDEPAPSTYPFRTCTDRGSEYPLSSTATLPWSTYSIQAAQTAMNTIYKSANYGTGAEQKTGLRNCYGINLPSS
jgi:hypothetical protein